MSKKPVGLKSVLNSYRWRNGCPKQECSKEDRERYERMFENGKPLPDDICRETASDGSIHYFKVTLTLTEQEINELINYKNSETLNTIKRCLIFVTVIIAIGLFGTIIAALN